MKTEYTEQYITYKSSNKKGELASKVGEILSRKAGFRRLKHWHTESVCTLMVFGSNLGQVKAYLSI